MQSCQVLEKLFDVFDLLIDFVESYLVFLDFIFSICEMRELDYGIR